MILRQALPRPFMPDEAPEHGRHHIQQYAQDVESREADQEHLRKNPHACLLLGLRSLLVENAMFKIHDVTIRNNTQNDVVLIGHGERPETVADERIRRLLHGALGVEGDHAFDH